MINHSRLRVKFPVGVILLFLKNDEIFGKESVTFLQQRSVHRLRFRTSFFFTVSYCSSIYRRGRRRRRRRKSSGKKKTRKNRINRTFDFSSRQLQKTVWDASFSFLPLARDYEGNKIRRLIDQLRLLIPLANNYYFFFSIIHCLNYKRSLNLVFVV